MDNYKIIMIIGGAVIGALAIVVGLDITKVTVATEKYSLFVDPFKDQQSLFTMARVTIQNTGTESLHNVRVNFGSGDIQELGTLDPGEKIIVSPPEDNPMQFVMVTADEDVFVNKAYRTPSKMPGMMGS